MSYNNETKENKIWTKDKIDFYAQIRRNVDKESWILRDEPLDTSWLLTSKAMAL